MNATPLLRGLAVDRAPRVEIEHLDVVGRLAGLALPDVRRAVVSASNVGDVVVCASLLVIGMPYHSSKP